MNLNLLKSTKQHLEHDSAFKGPLCLFSNCCLSSWYSGIPILNNMTYFYVDVGQNVGHIYAVHQMTTISQRYNGLTTLVQLRSPAITDMLHVFIINWSFYKEIKLKTLSYEQFIVFFVTMQSHG